MWFQIFLTAIWVLTTAGVMMAFTNRELPRFWAWLILAGGTFGSMFLLIFFMYGLCLWGILLDCKPGLL